jgi:hypothetical protein
MVKRGLILIFVVAAFYVGVQFASVLFYAWEFEDFAADEVKYAPFRENDTTEHLTEHLRQQAQFYGLNLNNKDVVVKRHTDEGSGVTIISVDLQYASPVDLYYFSYQLRRHVHASTMY